MATKHPNGAPKQPGGGNGAGEGGESGGGKSSTALRERPGKTKPPAMWQVLLYNDDYTPMEFVVDILMRVFGHTYERATQVMLTVHTEGRGICGVYPRDVAATKVEQVMDRARRYDHPLRCGMEEV